MARKTVKIVDIIDNANKMLANSVCSKDERYAVIIFVENILHDAGAYRGYGYLYPSEVPEGHDPGINFDYQDKMSKIDELSISPDQAYEQQFAYTDETRRHYHK